MNEGLYHRGSGIFYCNPRYSYCPLVPKRDTFYLTDGSPMTVLLHTHDSFYSCGSKYSIVFTIHSFHCKRHFRKSRIIDSVEEEKMVFGFYLSFLKRILFALCSKQKCVPSAKSKLTPNIFFLRKNDVTISRKNFHSNF